MKYKYIEIKEIAQKPKTKVYGVFNIKYGEKLAEIYWDCGWRQYVITYMSNCKFSLGCTMDIIDFWNKEVK